MRGLSNNNSEIYVSHNVFETEKFAESLAKKAMPHDIFCLEGDLGVGKSIIAKAIGKFFNVKNDITSPTFTLLKTYKCNNKRIKQILHFDLYRIKNIDELYNIGFDEYIYSNDGITIIEWPEVSYEILPDKYTKISISKCNNLNHNELMKFKLNDNLSLDNIRIIKVEE